MLNPRIEAAINKQINLELHSAYNYLAKAAFCESRNLAGMARWMLMQREEEMEHAMKLYKHLMDRGGRLDLAAVDKPHATYTSIREMFQVALELERHNTAAVNELYALAQELKDYATQSHLLWFIDEQVEEEKLLGEMVALIDLAGESGSALIQLNRQLGERTGGSK